MHLQYTMKPSIVDGPSRTLLAATMNVCVLASSPLMWMRFHSWINGTDREREQVAHSPSVQMSFSADCTVDALLIRWGDRYTGPFLQCRLSFKQYKWEKRKCFFYWQLVSFSETESLAWKHAFLRGIVIIIVDVSAEKISRIHSRCL